MCNCVPTGRRRLAHRKLTSVSTTADLPQIVAALLHLCLHRQSTSPTRPPNLLPLPPRCLHCPPLHTLRPAESTAAPIPAAASTVVPRNKNSTILHSRLCLHKHRRHHYFMIIVNPGRGVAMFVKANCCGIVLIVLIVLTQFQR